LLLLACEERPVWPSVQLGLLSVYDAATTASLDLGPKTIMTRPSGRSTPGQAGWVPSRPDTLAPLVEEVKPAVVNIGTTQAPRQQPRRGFRAPFRGQEPFEDFFERFFGGPMPQESRPQQSLGSGFIIDKEGYILTNNHVLENAGTITVKLANEKEYEAKVVGRDPRTDLALIKINARGDLPVVRIGDSDSLQVGDWVLAIGSPFSLDHTVTAGIISAKGRDNIGGARNAFQSFLQTDAAINPGNSGGPLVSMSGDVIGINTAIVSQTQQSAGLGFALPSNVAVKVYNQLVQHGKVTRGGIGISYEAERNPQLCRAMGLKSDCGVIVNSVTPGMPAARAGMREGDVITEIDGTKITSPAVLLDMIANMPIGKTARFKVNRDGRETTVNVVIGDRAEVLQANGGGGAPDRNEPGDSSPARLGIRVQDITPEISRQMRLPSNIDGVYVASVDPGSIASDAGLDRGMIITRIIAGRDRFEIRNVEDFRRAEGALKSGTDAAFMIMARNPATNQYQSSFVPITIP